MSQSRTSPSRSRGLPPDAKAPADRRTCRIFAIKAEIRDPLSDQFHFVAQKTMYGGRHIAEGDTVYLFASDHRGGSGLFARAIVTRAASLQKQAGLARQTPRATIAVLRTGSAVRRLGRAELKNFDDWNDGRPETELNFKLYRQATDKIVGLSDEVARYLDGYFTT